MGRMSCNHTNGELCRMFWETKVLEQTVLNKTRSVWQPIKQLISYWNIGWLQPNNSMEIASRSADGSRMGASGLPCHFAALHNELLNKGLMRESYAPTRRPTVFPKGGVSLGEVYHRAGVPPWTIKH